MRAQDESPQSTLSTTLPSVLSSVGRVIVKESREGLAEHVRHSRFQVRDDVDLMFQLIPSRGQVDTEVEAPTSPLGQTPTSPRSIELQPEVVPQQLIAPEDMVRVLIQQKNLSWFTSSPSLLWQVCKCATNVWWNSIVLLGSGLDQPDFLVFLASDPYISYISDITGRL